MSRNVSRYIEKTTKMWYYLRVTNGYCEVNMKKVILGILSIVIILIVSCIIGIQLSSTNKKSEKDEIAEISAIFI